MDGIRFDALTKRLAVGGLTRRHLLRTLGGAVAGGALAVAGREQAGAFICRQPGVLCAKDAHCCSGSCGEDHRCACLDDLTLCRQDCANLLSDPSHCGDCTTVCESGVCEQGSCCVPDCTDKRCGDDDGCGGTCDGGCATGSICAGGTCVVGQGTCQADQNHCTDPPLVPVCDNLIACGCFISTEGELRCGQNFGFYGDCTSTSDCAQNNPNTPGIFCVSASDNCFDNSFCLPPCPA